MENVLAILISIFLIYIFFRLCIWLWKNIIVPTGKLVYKMTYIAVICIAFSLFFLSKDLGINSLPRELQVMIVGGVGLFAGWKHLKSKGIV